MLSEHCSQHQTQRDTAVKSVEFKMILANQMCYFEVKERL